MVNMEIECIPHLAWMLLSFRFSAAILVCNYKNTAIKSTINIYYFIQIHTIHSLNKQKKMPYKVRCLHLTHIHSFVVLQMYFIWWELLRVPGFCRWIQMVNNNNLLSFGLRCGDSVTFLFSWKQVELNVLPTGYSFRQSIRTLL